MRRVCWRFTKNAFGPRPNTLDGNELATTSLDCTIREMTFFYDKLSEPHQPLDQRHSVFLPSDRKRLSV